MVSSAPAMGYERHYLFYGEEGPKPTVYDYGTIYTPIYGDLDEQYARIAEEFCFVSERVGFVSFRFELYETAPDLFRTADGGKTWRRVALPMGTSRKTTATARYMSQIFRLRMRKTAL